jgi:hypothetical protein
MFEMFAADWRLIAAFFQAGGARKPEQFAYVILRLIGWFNYFAGYHRKPEVRRRAQDCRDEIKAGFELWDERRVRRSMQ